MVSGETKSIGKILFGNRNFFNFLGLFGENIEEYHLSQFIPKPFNNWHDEFLLKIVDESSSEFSSECNPLFLLNSDGFICECVFKAYLVGDAENLYFICSADPVIHESKEVAIIDYNGYIHSHSKKFPLFLGLSENRIEKKLISEFLLNFSVETASFNEFLEYSIVSSSNN